MSKTDSVRIVSFAIAVLLSFSPVNANDAIKKKTLELYPQADTNGDGVLSDAEEAALSRQALKRFPQADRDGDGVLSDAEKQRLLRTAANRAKPKPASPTPDRAKASNAASFANVKYGEHERQVFDIWLADTSEPSPLAIFIHGGGFKAGSKEKLNPNDLSRLLKAGISVAAINYRYVSIAPLPAAHHDARRALQLMRSKADEWNIDKERVAAFGGSAGAQICMWLAFTDDMADPESTDPIERESTRLTCVATAGGQTTNDIDFYRNELAPLLGGKRKIESLARPPGKRKRSGKGPHGDVGSHDIAGSERNRKELFCSIDHLRGRSPDFHELWDVADRQIAKRSQKGARLAHPSREFWNNTQRKNG